MNLSFVFLRYLEANVLLAIVAGFLFTLRNVHISSVSLLRISRVLVVSALALPVLMHFLARPSFIHPSAQVWHSSSMRTSTEISPTKTQVTLSPAQKSKQVPAVYLKILVISLALATLFLLLRHFFSAFRLLSALKREVYPFKKYRRLKIYFSDRVAIPCSYRTPSGAYVIAPTYLAQHPDDLKIALLHEIQHHRQKDTLWVYALEILRGVFLFNPAVHLLSKQLSQIQEFACDEALVGHKHVSPHAYGGCLLKVAETAPTASPVLAGTACMAAERSGAFLKRRIQRMFVNRYISKSAVVSGSMFALVFLTAVSYAVRTNIRDRRIDLNQARALAKQVSGDFPITINEQVLEELNRFAGTPDGREFIRRSLSRKEKYQKILDEKFAKYRIPRDLMALPITESGYFPHVQTSGAFSAGIWQITPGTGKVLGLNVENPDERLDMEKATDAALKYLSILYQEFNDWELATTAYNLGEYKLRKGMSATGLSNAWELYAAGVHGDRNYLARTVAAVLLMNNPQILE